MVKNGQSNDLNRLAEKIRTDEGGKKRGLNVLEEIAIMTKEVF